MKKLSSKKEEKKLTDEEYQKYYCYLRDVFEKSKLNNLNIKTRRRLYPLLISVIKFRNRLNGYQLKVIGDERSETIRPIIYAVTHIGKADIEVVSEVIGKHFFLLSGDFESLHDTVDGMFLGINGVLYFNEKDREDRQNVKRKMENVLLEGGSILYFPEGTWNLSPNLPLNRCYYGIIEVALNANAIIIPIALEQYDKQFIAKVGNNFDVKEYMDLDTEPLHKVKIKVIQYLRDELASLKWDIWESVAPLNRSLLPDDYFEKFIQDKIGQWPTLTLEDFTKAICRDKESASPEEVFEPIKKLEYKKETAFLFYKNPLDLKIR